jgi:hypothetical protein
MYGTRQGNIMRNIAKNTLLVLLSTVMLVGCGDGSSVDMTVPEPHSGNGVPVSGVPLNSAAAPAPVPDPVTGAYSLRDCFELKSGTKFERSDKNKALVVQEIFNGGMMFGEVLLRPDDKRIFARYLTIDRWFATYQGDHEYDQLGNLLATSTGAIDYRLDAVTDEVETVRYMRKTTTVGPPPVYSDKAFFWDRSFAGFETLTLGGRRFDNVCILDIENQLVPGEINRVWIAKGFGEIKREVRDTQGVRIPNSPGFVLTRIISAP